MRERQFLIAGGGAVILVLAFYLVPLLLPEDLSATVENKKNLLQRQRDMIAQEETIKARINQDQQRLNQDLSRLLPYQKASDAGPALQKVLQDLADANQVEMSRKNIQPEQKIDDNLTKVTVQIDVTCTMDQLVRFLAAIENYEKFLKVDALSIMQTGMRNRDQIRPSLWVAGFVAIPALAAKTAEKAPGAK
ncbi:MAG: type II secretion system protein M [Acidobacteriia bacterium]|nr:type II secretion system protein M [Terriglobia bacterium]